MTEPETAEAKIARLTAENERLKEAIEVQARATRTVHQTTLASVRHLQQMDRIEYVAAQTLDSEREANARLTDEVERYRKSLRDIARLTADGDERVWAIAIEALGGKATR